MLEHSLAGRWVVVARVWVDANAPCTVMQYFEEVAPMMPTHIRRGGYLRTKLSIAKEALRLIRVTVSDDGMIYPVRKKPRLTQYSHNDTIKAMTRPNGLVVLEGLPPKEHDALRKYLKTHGWIHTGVTNTYRRLRPEDLADL